MTITQEFRLKRGKTTHLLCFAANSVGRTKSKYYAKGGTYLPNYDGQQDGEGFQETWLCIGNWIAN